MLRFFFWRVYIKQRSKNGPIFRISKNSSFLLANKGFYLYFPYKYLLGRKYVLFLIELFVLFIQFFIVLIFLPFNRGLANDIHSDNIIPGLFNGKIINVDKCFYNYLKRGHRTIIQVCHLFLYDFDVYENKGKSEQL
jgi:hypothetical protein